MYLSLNDIQQMDKISRLNLINSITGVKPSNLIGTKSKDGFSNLAIFSSVVHLGSKPPLIGFITRPAIKFGRHTLKNIIETKCFTINHVSTEIVENAHFTSAKFPKEISEFKMCGLNEIYHDNFSAPFVKESSVKIGLHLKEIIPINSNKSTLVIGQIEHLILDSSTINNNYILDLEKSKGVGIGGLSEYYKLKKITDYPYARVDELPKFNNKS